MWPFTPKGYKQSYRGFIVIKGDKVYIKTIDGKRAYSVDSIVRRWGTWPIWVRYAITADSTKYFPSQEFYPVYKLKFKPTKPSEFRSNYGHLSTEEKLRLFEKAGAVSSHIIDTIRSQGGRYLHIQGYSVDRDP